MAYWLSSILMLWRPASIVVFVFYAICVNAVYLAAPGALATKHIWGPASEEMLKCALIVRNRHFGFWSRVLTGASFGFVDGGTKYLAWHQELRQLHSSNVEATFLFEIGIALGFSMSIVAHSLFAMGYIGQTPNKMRWYWAPPLIIHYLCNFLAYSFISG